MLVEAERNIVVKLPAALPAFRAIVRAAVDVVSDPPSSDLSRLGRKAHPKDLPVLAAAVAAAADLLATFNVRHFRVTQPPPVVLPPGAVLARVRQSLATLLASP